jgi:hypothetical protein
MMESHKGEVPTLIFPKRFAIDEATSMEAAAMMLVTKNMVPSVPEGRLNLVLKK